MNQMSALRGISGPQQAPAKMLRVSQSPCGAIFSNHERNAIIVNSQPLSKNLVPDP